MLNVIEHCLNQRTHPGQSSVHLKDDATMFYTIVCVNSYLVFVVSTGLSCAFMRIL